MDWWSWSAEEIERVAQPSSTTWIWKETKSFSGGNRWQLKGDLSALERWRVHLSSWSLLLPGASSLRMVPTWDHPLGCLCTWCVRHSHGGTGVMATESHLLWVFSASSDSSSVLYCCDRCAQYIPFLQFPQQITQTFWALNFLKLFW